MSLAELTGALSLEEELSYEEILTSDFSYIITHPLEYLKAYVGWGGEAYKPVTFI